MTHHTRSFITILFIGVVSLLSPHAAAAADSESALFPFVLPWDDSSPGIANISGWLHKPAGKYGQIRAGADGHLYAGTERIRLRGVDITHAANFPDKADAEKIAARLAKFGVNIVRFHHMDQLPYPKGLYLRNKAGTREFDPEALDRMDYYMNELRKKGIYSFICLLNYRPISAADGLPKDIELAKGNNYQGRHVVGFFDRQIIDLQKEFANKLLTHTNAYTGIRYADDPAVAFVEVNNENGLFQAMLGGFGDTIPDFYLKELQEQWNDWLLARYGSDERMRGSWNLKNEPLGDELLRNISFADGTNKWLLEQNAGAEANAAAVNNIPAELGSGKAMQVEVTRPGTQSWHIRFEQRELNVGEGRLYTLEFWAKADAAATMDVSVSMNKPPWKVLGMMNTVRLTTAWLHFHFISRMSQSDDAARLVFDPQMKKGSYFIAGASLRPGGTLLNNDNARLEQKQIPVMRGEITASAQRDWLRFLWDTEDRYWKTMQRYIKNDLGVKQLVIGTIVGCSTPNLMAQFDAIDTHAYWQHPSPWDMVRFNYVVGYPSMVNDLGGLIPNLALRSVAGKPFCITEYGHCAPNTFVSEGDLIRGAYAGLQDWDYLSTSRYAHEARWDNGSICNFIDIDQHPTKMVVLIPSGAMYLRGDVKAARQTVCTSISKDREIDILQTAGSRWDVVQGGHAGVPHTTPLKHRTLIAVDGQTPPAGALRPDQVKLDADRVVSDTGELDWDLTLKQRGVVTVNTAGSKAVIGYGGGKRYELGDVVIEPGSTMQDGWSAVTITRMNAPEDKTPARWLVTATGYVKNTGAGWVVEGDKIRGKGKSWGTGPTLVEGIPARITVPCAADRCDAWTLDERGQRGTPVELKADARGNAMIEIGPRYKTLWYEITAR